MKRRSHDLDRLLDGSAPAPEGPLADLIAALRAPVGPTAENSHHLVAALAEEARMAEGASQARPGRTFRPLPSKWRRRAMLSTFLSTLLGKLAVGTAALAVTTGGLAATGNLPDPAQQWVADAVARIGIDLPSPEDEHDGVFAEEGVTNATAHCAEDPQAEGCDVLDTVFSGDPSEEGYGEGVADTASEGSSSQGRETAEEGGSNADDYRPGDDEAGELPDLPEQADRP